MSQADQLERIRRLHALFAGNALEYWLFGGWAVDFHAQRVTRDHADIDIAIWLADLRSVHTLLENDGWTHSPAPDEDGYTHYQRDGVELDLAFLARDEQDIIHTPLRHGRGDWPPDSFPGDIAELEGARAHVVSLGSLVADKSTAKDDPVTTGKDRADVTTLTRLAR